MLQELRRGQVQQLRHIVPRFRRQRQRDSALRRKLADDLALLRITNGRLVHLVGKSTAEARRHAVGDIHHGVGPNGRSCVGNVIRACGADQCRNNEQVRNDPAAVQDR